MRDARACISSLQSGQGGILLEGAHFSRVSNIPLPAAAFGGDVVQNDSADGKTSQTSFVLLEESMAFSH